MAQSKRPSAGGGGPSAPIVEQLGPRLRAEFEALEKSGRKIVKALGDQRTAEEFSRDPAAALRRMKVDVPPLIGARLKQPGLMAGLVAPRSYQLPNGQVVTARVTVRFTAGDRATSQDEDR